MDNLDLAVISQLNRWITSGDDAWLCTVINTWGSAPRIPGSLLTCNRKGDVVGSLSGGCVEDALLAALKTGELASDTPCFKRYGETDSEREQLKLPCGGTLGVLIEPFSTQLIAAYPALKEQFVAIEQALQQRQLIKRHRQWQPRDTSTGHQFVEALASGEKRVDLELDPHNQPQQFEQVYGPVVHLMILGVCEVGRYLADFALATGFRVSICDPRPEQIAQWQIDNCSVFTGMPDDVIREHATDANTAIVAVSHDPRIDDMGLMDAFNTDAFYIGAMGSINTSRNRRKRLADLGITETQLQRLHAPIGLDIGSKTPAEIAISIIADIIASKNLSTH